MHLIHINIALAYQELKNYDQAVHYASLVQFSTIPVYKITW
jgi:hypothetical protein